MEKPKITQDQMVSASTVARDFSAVRKKAKTVPLFILDRGKIDSVLLGYDQFERMYMRLQELEEELLIRERSREMRENPDLGVPWRAEGRKGKE